MSDKTNIAWTDSTINFWSGCTKVSPGCTNCYAEARDARMMQEKVIHWGKGAKRLKHVGAVKSALAMNRKPWICPVCGHGMMEEESKGYVGCPNGAAQKAWLESDRLSPVPPPRVMHVAQHHRRRIFSLSLGDWLDDEVPIEWLAEMLDTIRQCTDVTWILCTKRPENWRSRLVAAHAFSFRDYNAETSMWMQHWIEGDAPLNIILLTSVENQEQADKRIPELLKIPAACRGLSLEPLIGPVHVRKALNPAHIEGNVKLDGLDWLIIGGESGPNARPCNVDWIRSLVSQGKAAGVATFAKQLGAVPYTMDASKFPDGRLVGQWNMRDKKGGDPSEWPKDLQIQQWPKGF